MTDPASGTERRSNPQLRKIFVEAYDVLEPFFNPDNDWGGQHHEHLAYLALHERFPELTPIESFALVTAAKRVFHSSAAPVAP